MPLKYHLPIPKREPDGQWDNQGIWILRASRDIGGMNALCADAKDRICCIGLDFQRAEDEGTYPIRFWYGAGGETTKEQAAARKRHREVEKMNHPWRYK